MKRTSRRSHDRLVGKDSDMAYDVFISYRRETGADDARLLQQALKARGYNVFFDYDSLRDGKFDEKIFEAIDEAPVFVLMLTERALDRCVNADDWVRLEIERAISKGKKIISVAPSDQSWGFPDNLPDSICSVKTEQASELNKASLFEESIDKIIDERFPAALHETHISSVDGGTVAFAESKHRGNRTESKGKKLSRINLQLVSTVTPPSHVFVGREAELVRLRELLVSGKFPVITGPGGTGKSELVRQYVARFQSEYPGGLFQIDMENVNDWNEVFVNMVQRGTNVGVDVRGILKPEKHEESTKGTCPDDEIPNNNPIVVRQELTRHIDKFGPALIVLDNVEVTSKFLREQVLTKLALHQDIRIVATARTSDIAFKQSDKCVELPLSDLPPDVALDLLLKDHPIESDAEKKAAESVAERLGYRALYLKAVPSLMDDNYSPYSGSYQALDAALQKNLLEIVSEGVVAVEDSLHEPSVLWNLTRESFARHPHGADWVLLARMASFFRPEGFRKRVLNYLWDSIVRPCAGSGQLFDKALDVLRLHGVIDVHDEMLSMHRLTRAAVLSSTRTDVPELEGEVGKILAGYFEICPSDWVGLSESITILRHIPKSQLNNNLCLECLLKNQSFAEMCPWERLGGREWARVLISLPHLANKCPWEKLTGEDWVDLLVERPDFADKCQWEKIHGGIHHDVRETSKWVTLLCAQPQFADKCPWENLDGSDWVDLLGGISREESSARPQFSNKCDWRKLNGTNWAQLLRVQPQFADKCDWKKLEGKDWADLLQIQPQFAEMCDWKKLDVWNWVELLRVQPQLADNCRGQNRVGFDLRKLFSWLPQFAGKCDWRSFTGENWVRLLCWQPQFAGKCDWRTLIGADWAQLLCEQPQFARRCDWGKLEAYDWWILLQRQPQFAEKYGWAKIKGSQWADLLSEQPQLADKCDWKKLDGRDWSSLLCVQPQFADKCDWSKMGRGDWRELLLKQPGFVDRCDWHMFDADDLVRLLNCCPQLADRYLWEKFDGEHWVRLLRQQPQYASKCPWEKLNGADWSRLLRDQPQFADKCCWEKFKGRNWADLLTVQPQFAESCPFDKFNGSDWVVFLLFCNQSQLICKCPWENLSGRNWANLLSDRPQFADYCLWDKLDGYAWSQLLRKCPQFADKCSWEKLDGDDWKRLSEDQSYLLQHVDKCLWGKLDRYSWVAILRLQPQFASKCHKWEEFTVDNWCELLCAQPQFADKCDWSKLSDEDWANLLEHQPQLADRRVKKENQRFNTMKV